MDDDRYITSGWKKSFGTGVGGQKIQSGKSFKKFSNTGKSYGVGYHTDIFYLNNELDVFERNKKQQKTAFSVPQHNNKARKCKRRCIRDGRKAANKENIKLCQKIQMM